MSYEVSPSDLGSATPSALEQFTRTRYFVLFLSFFFYLEAVLWSIGGINLLEFDLQWAQDNLTIGHIILTFAGFSCLHTFILPLSRQILWHLGVQIYYSGVVQKFIEFIPRSRNYFDGVPERSVLSYALQEENEVLYSYYAQHMNDREKSINHKNNLYKLSVLGFFYLWFIPETALERTLRYLGVGQDFYLGVASLIFGLMFFFSFKSVTSLLLIHLPDSKLRKRVEQSQYSVRGFDNESIER